MKPLPSDTANKLVGLEAFRFLTAFAILIYHYRHFSFVADASVGLDLARLPLYWFLRAFFNSGAFGVWVFWCISGFIFFWKYRDPIADRAVGGWTFFMLRFSRLYPLHLVMLLLVALLQAVYFNLRGAFFVYQDNDLPHFLTQLFMASEWGITHGETFDGPIWSVSVEVLVYLLFFLMLRATRSWWLNVVIIAVCFGAWHFKASGHVTNCLALFYAGGLAAAARRLVDGSRFKTTIEACAWLVPIVVMPLVIYALRDRLDDFDLALFAGFTPVLLFCLSREFGFPRAAQAMIVAAGNMTYSSYLIHFPLQLAIMICFALAGRSVPIYSGALFAVYLLTTLLLSYVTFRFFEAPAQNLIRSAFRGSPGEALKQASSV